jgi:hypothetical protein
MKKNHSIIKYELTYLKSKEREVEIQKADIPVLRKKIKIITS